MDEVMECTSHLHAETGSGGMSLSRIPDHTDSITASNGPLITLELWH